MTISLKLDTAAVNSLFPEGSEARLQLQQAVINNVVDRMPSNSNLEAYVYDQFIKKQFVDLLTQNNKSVEFNNKMTNSALVTVGKLIDQTFAEATRKAFDQMEKEKINELQEKLKEKVDDFFLDQQQHIIYQIRKNITAKVEQIVNTMFSEITTK